MHTDENNVIRYLMKEMDPSEEIEFEKQMREDEDLLIEVESMRVTNRKLSGLPQKNPPEHLTNKVLEDVKKLQSNKSNFRSQYSFLFNKVAVAALLLITISGGYIYYSSSTGNDTLPTSQSDTTEPWVDRNEVIRFSAEQLPSESSALESELLKSYEKLQLVTDPSGTNSSGNSILLTGSSN